MLEPLIEITGSSELAEFGWVRMTSCRWIEDAIELQLEIDEGQGGRPLAHWIVRCFEVGEHMLCDADGGGLQVSGSDHPVVRQHLDPRTSLFFGASPTPGSDVVGGLFSAHRDLVDDWIAFDRYLNLSRPLEELLVSGSGMIATGPRFLLQAYANVLDRAGMEASLVDVAKAQRVPPLHVAHLGESYVVARRFEAERL